MLILDKILYKIRKSPKLRMKIEMRSNPNIWYCKYNMWFHHEYILLDKKCYRISSASKRDGEKFYDELSPLYEIRPENIFNDVDHIKRTKNKEYIYTTDGKTYMHYINNKED